MHTYILGQIVFEMVVTDTVFEIGVHLTRVTSIHWNCLKINGLAN